MSDLKSQLNADVKSALQGKDKQRVGTLRLILAAIKQREVDERITLDDEQVLLVLDKMAKQRRESISQYEKANRDDLVAQENFELALIKGYLPEQLSDAEIAQIVDSAITDSGAASMKDMGKVMGLIKPALQGRADLGAVSATIKARLS